MAHSIQSRGQLFGASNNQQAQLGTAYGDLCKELDSENLKVVGGYTLGRVIGEGTFGSVHLATHRLTGTRCAIKKIPKSATTHLAREIHHHRRLHHPHIVHLHEIVATESHVWLVSELCSGGELFDYLVERGRLPEVEARRLFGELTVAVGWLHRQGVVHRDLKLENVLLDGELRIKLGDLGFAREWQRGRLMETYCGTTGYASPEMLACRKYLGVETDVWSLGVILYTLLCGGLPFDDDDEIIMKTKISTGIYEEPEWLSAESRSLIHGILQTEPSERLSIENILKHPWFKMPINDNSLPPTPNPGSLPPGKSPSDTMISNSISRTHEEATSDYDSEIGYHQDNAHKEILSPSIAERETPSQADIIRNHSGEFSHTEKQLEFLHSNSSQSTIRRPELRGEGRSLTGISEEAENAQDQLEVPFVVPLHSRTPSRTKRRSVSSQLSLERRHSHYTNGTPDYWQVLNEEPAAIFSRPAEKHLLKGLTALGIDVGQLMHSVASDACDSAAAMWWIMRAKQLERGETDASVQAMNAAATRRRERAAAYAKEERRKARSEQMEANLSPAPRQSEVASADPAFPPRLSAEGINRSGFTFDTSHPETPSRDPSIRPDLLSSPTDGSPKDRERMKARSPSMSMLQRATSALTGKWADDKTTSEEPGRTSPTKLVKSQPKAKTAEIEIVPSPSPTSTMTVKHNASATIATEIPKAKGVKKDSLWSTFRHMFAEDRKRKRYPMTSGTAKMVPTVVLSRGPAARGPHVNRLPQPSARRGSLDLRPNLHSRRSSSVNSRRSSVTSAKIPHDTHETLPTLGRRSSHRSHGSQTPTSDREHLDFPSRPNSATSHRHGSNRHSSASFNIRSPSLHSEHSSRAPASPLHDYQRRHPSGSNSRRVRHFTIVPESKILKSSSVASSIRSNNSSRRSSLDRGRPDDMTGESDYDTGRDDVSIRSLRRRADPHQHSLAHQIHRNRSPLVHGATKIAQVKFKQPARDVFQQKDDEWEDEDDPPTFQGGLGQATSAWPSQHKPRGAASFPSSALPIKSKHQSQAVPRDRNHPNKALREEKNGTNDTGRESSTRRVGLPERSGKPPIVMEEVEEEEEE